MTPEPRGEIAKPQRESDDVPGAVVHCHQGEDSRIRAEECLAQQAWGGNDLIRCLLVGGELVDHRENLRDISGRCFANGHDHILVKVHFDRSRTPDDRRFSRFSHARSSCREGRAAYSRLWVGGRVGVESPGQ